MTCFTVTFFKVFFNRWVGVKECAQFTNRKERNIYKAGQNHERWE